MEAKTGECVYKTMGAKGFWQPPEEAGRDAWDRRNQPCQYLDFRLLVSYEKVNLCCVK